MLWVAEEKGDIDGLSDTSLNVAAAATGRERVMRLASVADVTALNSEGAKRQKVLKGERFSLGRSTLDKLDTSSTAPM